MGGLRFPLAVVRRGAGVGGVWRLVAAVGTALVLAGLVVGSAAGATTLPVLWEAGGLDAGRRARVRRRGSPRTPRATSPWCRARRVPGPRGDVVHAGRNAQVARDRVSVDRDVHR